MKNNFTSQLKYKMADDKVIEYNNCEETKEEKIIITDTETPILDILNIIQNYEQQDNEYSYKTFDNSFKNIEK